MTQNILTRSLEAGDEKHRPNQEDLLHFAGNICFDKKQFINWLDNLGKPKPTNSQGKLL